MFKLRALSICRNWSAKSTSLEMECISPANLRASYDRQADPALEG